MGSFITGTELQVIRDEGWEPWESVTIREYSQAEKDVQDKELIEMAGLAGQLPRIVMQSALIPVLVAGIASWTLRNLSVEETLRLYGVMAKQVGSDVESLTDGQKCEAVKDIPIVPVTREWIGKLKPRTYSGFIAEGIRELNRGRTDAEVRDFLRDAGAGDTNEREAAA